MLITCTCVHPYQDGLYGPGKRAAVPKGSAKKPGEKGYACTVCGKLDDSRKASYGSVKPSATATPKK